MVVDYGRIRLDAVSACDNRARPAAPAAGLLAVSLDTLRNVLMIRRIVLSSLLALSLCAAALAQQPQDELPAPVASAAAWRPAMNTRWQIQYVDEPVDVNIEADVYKIDLFDNSARAVAAIKRRGKRAVCYVNVGAWEAWRPDAKQFSRRLLGKAYQGWPRERWLDIRRIDELAPVMLARLDLCRDRGFDGVLFDNLDLYLQDTGFKITAADQLRYIVWLANEARRRGLAVGINNNPQQVPQLTPYVDWAFAESCFSQGWCNELAPIAAAGKPVIVVEYVDDPVKVRALCGQALALRFTLIMKKRELDAFRQECAGARPASRS